MFIEVYSNPLTVYMYGSTHNKITVFRKVVATYGDWTLLDEAVLTTKGTTKVVHKTRIR